MKITGHSTVDTVLKDPEASEWLKAALRSALELKCDPTDVYKDAMTLSQLMMRYMSPIPGVAPRKQWPVERA